MVSNTPKISVIMPLYNAAPYLKESIESILAQTFSDFEFFIIDDKSSDNSAEIVKAYKDDRIIFIQKPENTGYTDSLNKSIKMANGKYIARMDADDISLPNRFEKQYNYMEQNPDILLLGTFYKIIGIDDIVKPPTTHDEIKVRLLFDNPICHSSVFMRKSFFDNSNSQYDRTFEPAEDYELWTRMSSCGLVENLPEVLLHYRVHENQVSNLHSKIQRANDSKVKSLVLDKLISFDHKNYDKELVLELLSPWCIQISCENLVKLKEFIADVVIENTNKKEYDQKLLEQLLRRVWLKYSFSAYNYNIKFLSIVFPGRLEKITRLSFKQSIKYIAKSIIGYRGGMKWKQM